MKFLCNFSFLLLFFFLPTKCASSVSLEIWVELIHGTPINIKLNESLDLDNLMEGQMLNCLVFGDCKVNQQVLIRSNDFASAEILEIRKRTRKSAEVIIVAVSAKAIDGQIVDLYSSYFYITIKKDTPTLGRMMKGFVKNSVKIDA